MNPTAIKFGYPRTLLRRFDHWLVLLRPEQVTLGSLVLVCTDPAASLGGISERASSELLHVARSVEGALRAAYDHDKINYVMLMMVDPDVHFHVFPRYSAERWIGERRFIDVEWPGPPNVRSGTELPDDIQQALMADLGRRIAPEASED